ncbi:unnamed protein product [Hyaloperonospora brassicae]|uniref:Solute carrier family 40 protein n=1 Tax=Hyaloperonospora brassicae TaxID=162125 RepID=A0AAV0TGJ9_HYABA|nr:unnamed protein product [Hyaloperonospora brassicae]
MFAASWSVVDLFGGVQIWREQSRELTASEPLNNVLLSTTSAGLVTFVAGHIGGAGFAVSALLTALVVAAAWWTLTGARAKRAVPSFKAVQVVDGSPSEIFKSCIRSTTIPILSTLSIDPCGCGQYG